MFWWKWLKTWIFFTIYQHFYLFVIIFFTLKVSKEPNLRSAVWENPMLLVVGPPQPGAEQHKMHLHCPRHRRKKQNKNLIIKFKSRHSTWVKLLRTRVHSGRTRERNLSSECCQTWQDAAEWCICLMYLQRNKNTVTASLHISPPPPPAACGWSKSDWLKRHFCLHVCMCMVKAMRSGGAAAPPWKVPEEMHVQPQQFNNE